MPIAKERRKKYYRKYMRKYYRKHKEYWQEYYAKRVGKVRKRKASIDSRNLLTNVREIWFAGKEQPSIEAKPKDRRLREKKLIELASNKILPTERFDDITILNPYAKEKTLRFHILANRKGKKCGIICTTSYTKVLTKNLREKLKKFLKFFDVNMYICFVKPDFSKYYLAKIDRNNPKTVTIGLKRIARMKDVAEIMAT